MAQVKIFGNRSFITEKRQQISDAVHMSVMDALSYPREKRFHRFIGLDDGDFIYPEGRSEQYVIIELSMFEGRTVDAKKNLIRTLFSMLDEKVGISPQDVEITIFETPRENWGIRGVPGDELALGYKVEV